VKPEECVCCEECEQVAEEIITINRWWAAWGRNCADFNWGFHDAEDEKLQLCRDCYERDWIICETCGDAVEWDHYGVAYLPDGYKGAPVCPRCAASL